MSKNQFSGRRVWVTGASSGIGQAVAVELRRRGATVIASARNQEALEKLAADTGTHALPLNVTDRRATQEAAQSIQDRFGGLDVAVLNAGTCEYVDVRHFEAPLFERVMRTNFLSMVYGIEAMLPLLRESTCPHLVGMSSSAAYAGLPRAEAYGASKAAIRYLLDSLRVDLVSEQIPVSVICPGFVRTPLTDLNDFPMPFLVEVEDAARIIVDGIARYKYEIHFPKRLSLAFKLLGLLPHGLYTRLASRMARTA